MHAIDVLRELLCRGYEVMAAGDELRVRPAALDDALCAVIRAQGRAHPGAGARPLPLLRRPMPAGRRLVAAGALVLGVPAAARARRHAALAGYRPSPAQP